MAQTPPRGLTPHFVKTVTRPGTYGDGYGAFGLTFRVRIGARGRVTKSWLQRLPVEAGRRDIGLGSYPAVLLPLARQRALENWQAVKAGVDIHAARRPIPTLAEGFDIVIADLASSWTSDSTEKEWRRHKAYCGPLLATPISDVTKRHVSDVIAAHRTPKNRVPNDLRAKISVVMQWAIDQDYRHDNPAPHQHHPDHSPTPSPVAHEEHAVPPSARRPRLTPKRRRMVGRKTLSQIPDPHRRPQRTSS